MSLRSRHVSGSESAKRFASLRTLLSFAFVLGLTVVAGSASPTAPRAEASVAEGSTLQVQVAGRAGVPADASAAVINFTAVRAEANGYLTAYPCGEAKPTASTLNYRAGASASANLAVVELGANGKVCIFSLSAVDVVADVNGWFPAGAEYTSRSPERLIDTRGTGGGGTGGTGTGGSGTGGSGTGGGGTGTGGNGDSTPDGRVGVYEPVAGCGEGRVVPLGQAPGAVNFEPLGSIWCFDLGEPPAQTAVEGSNSWVDDFTVGCPVPSAAGCTSMMSLDDRDLGYRVFDQTGESPGRSQHWINQNHWMVDAKDGFTGGASISPDRSFRFENGKFVVEGDFAAAIPEYADDTWGEITITSAPRPTGVFADALYGYGQFGGHWAVGCRLESSRTPVCAIEGASASSPPSSGRCFSIPGNYRVAEMSFFQRCGSSVMGGSPHGGLEKAWRECAPAGPDMACRDRFRLEITKSSLTLYVNGVKYMQDANWPAAHQLPDSFVNGDIYVYQSNWQHRAGSRAYRYHWDHFAVNPPTGPTASESF